MVFQDGNIDPGICFDQRLVYLGLFQRYTAGNGYFFKIFLVVTRHDDTARFLYGGSYTACFIAFLPVVARMVEYCHFFGPCFETFLYEGFYQFRIRVTGQFRRTIPSDIGFDNDFLSFLDIFADAAKCF